MNNKFKILFLLMSVFLVFIFLNKTDDVNQSVNSEDLTIPVPSDFLSMGEEIGTIATGDISDIENKDLVFMREEEKLARDVYVTLYEKWGMNIFNNISQSEQTHTNSVKMLITKYNIVDPVSEDIVGRFKDETLSKLFIELTNEGQKSLIDALKVGALIEDLDIKDLEERILRTDNDDIKLVYENLMKGSRNHLRSFVAQIVSRGASYEAKYISQKEFDEIVSSDRETGFVGGKNMHNRGN